MIGHICFMNISKINLNLLTALDALLTERNVTKAGEKLFITQSAMSNVLKQLRALFQDELLVLQGRKMVLTLRAESLHPQLKQLLTQAEVILNPQAFDPKSSKRLFTIGMEEYTDIIILPRLYNYLAQHAPHIQLRIKHVPLFGEKPLLDSQEIDLAIGLLQKAHDTQGIFHDLLFREKIVCIARKNHPLFKKKLTLKQYLTAKHISFLPTNENTPYIVDNILGNMGYERNVVLRLSHITPALYTINDSDVVATVPERLAVEAKRLFNFSVQACPFAIPEVAFSLLWHPWTHLDSANQWLRTIIKQLANDLN
jgi:DNA-binding transcriptional LysR family regulator